MKQEASVDNGLGLVVNWKNSFVSRSSKKPINRKLFRHSMFFIFVCFCAKLKIVYHLHFEVLPKNYIINYADIIICVTTLVLTCIYPFGSMLAQCPCLQTVVRVPLLV